MYKQFVICDIIFSYSEFTHYISGFVAKTVSQKINCLICKQVLSINHTTNLLITLKDRNNALFKPSKGCGIYLLCSWKMDKMYKS